MKDNKLIAEFMGHEFTLMPDTDGKCYTEKDSWDIIHEDDFIVDGGWYAYNTSWNGLMPVVEKCLEMHNSLIDGRDVIDTSYPSIAQALQVVSLKETYKAVVEFIKNQTK